MSYQGMTWVDEVALPHLKNQGELIVMLRVANFASNGPKRMSGCYASSETLADLCVQNKTTTQRHLRELKRRGLLVPGDPELVDHLPADKRPPVYDLGGAHEEGCPGGHGHHEDCRTGPGRQNAHPQKNTRSSGGRNDHPHARNTGAGRQKRPERVGKTPTKGSKELNSSLSMAEADAEPAATPGHQPQEEREKKAPPNDQTPPAPQDTEPPHGGLEEPPQGVEQVVQAYVQAHEDCFGFEPDTSSIRAEAVQLLGGRKPWPVTHVVGLVSEMPAKGYVSLLKHARHNPPPQVPGQRTGPGSADRLPDACADHDPVMPGRPDLARRFREGPSGQYRCPYCHPGAADYQGPAEYALNRGA